MSKPLNWGIISTGSIARAFAEAIPQTKEAALWSVYSRKQDTADRFARKHGIPNTHTSYAGFLADPALDVILVGSPHPFHKEQTIQGLEAGKHVLCEKPMALNGRDVAEMIAAARANDRFLMEAMWMYFIPAIRRAVEIVDRGEIGDPGMVLASFGSVVPFDPKNRFYDPALGGGALLDMGIYVLALAYLFFGKPDSITGTAAIGETGVDEQAAISLAYPGGRLANLVATIRSNTACDAQIAGSRGHLHIHPKFWHPEKLTRSMRDGTTEEIAVPMDRSGYAYEIDHVNACIRQGLLESDVISWQTSLDFAWMMDSLRAQWGLSYPGEK